MRETRSSKRPRKSTAFSGWAASLMGATVIAVLTVASLQYFNSQGDAATSTPTAPAASSATDALAKSVEISGLRLVKSWTGKEQVRFLVINHSARDLSGVILQVSVKAPDGAGGSPLIMIHAPLHSLGSYQSKEIRTDLDSDLPASAMADWQSLRTEVQVIAKE